MVVTKDRNKRWEDVDKDLIELKVLAQHFELFNRTEGKSQKTIRWYNLALRLFEHFLIESEKSTKLVHLDESTVREFTLYLQGKNRWQDNPYVPTQPNKLAAISVQTYVRALRGFFNWLYKESYTVENRLGKLKPPKAPTKVFDILTPPEIARILTSLNPRTSSGARDYAVLVLFLDSGLRSGELTGAELDDTNIDSGLESAARCLRDKLLIRVLFHVGCRISEILGLEDKDVDFVGANITIEHLKLRIQISCT